MFKLNQNYNDEVTFTKKGFNEINLLVSGEFENFKIKLLEEITMFNEGFFKKIEELLKKVDRVEKNNEITKNQTNDIKTYILIKNRDIILKTRYMDEKYEEEIKQINVSINSLHNKLK